MAYPTTLPPRRYRSFKRPSTRQVVHLSEPPYRIANWIDQGWGLMKFRPGEASWRATAHQFSTVDAARAEAQRLAEAEPWLPEEQDLLDAALAHIATREARRVVPLGDRAAQRETIKNCAAARSRQLDLEEVVRRAQGTARREARDAHS